MGLDNEAVYQDESGWHLAPDDAFPDEVKWLVEGGGCHFRGKRYVSVVLDLTGLYLAQELIPPDAVAEAAQQLRQALKSGDLVASLRRDALLRGMDSEVQARALVAFFETCSVNGYGIVGSW